MDARNESLPSRVNRGFVVVSGLPGSGKTSVAKGLAPLLGLPLIDKDDILERLFDSKGIGDSEWRHALSQESNAIFRREAESSNGAVLVSFWHVEGMSPDSGTPTDWLRGLSNRIVHLHCECPPEIAASRYRERERHPGHLDRAKSEEETLRSLQDLARLKPFEAGPLLRVDTSGDVDLHAVAAQIGTAWGSSDRSRG